VAGGALLEFLAAGASAGIAISLYPVLKKWNGALALGSVVFRTIEAVMYIASLVSLLSLSMLSQELVGAGSTERASFQAIGDSFLNVREEAGLVGVLAFSVGALLYYYLFYRSRLVPRWLSSWGDGLLHSGAAHWCAGNRSGGLADSQGIQFVAIHT
jgi:hypothetical protein